MPEKPTFDRNAYHRENRAAWDAAYREKNREKRRAYDRERMRRKRANSSEH